MGTEPIIRVENLTKSYLGKPLFEDVFLAIRPGFTALMGPSGSGKTTLLNIIMGLDTADSGSVTVGDVEVTTLPQRDIPKWRSGNGMVFQDSGLLAGLSTLENIEYPHILSGRGIDTDWTLHLLDLLGIAPLMQEKAGRLSGGQRQKVALVRALAHRPRVVFGDEPTANLDTKSKADIHTILRDVAREVPVLSVSHDQITRDFADQVIYMRDGHVTV